MTIEVRQVHPLFVGEVGGMDLSQPVDVAVVRAIWEAIDRYAVLVFHDQHLDDVRLREFACNFSELEIGRMAARGGKRRLTLPEIGDISNLDEEGRLRERDDRPSTAWAIASGTPTLLICRCRSCWGCSMRSPCPGERAGRRRDRIRRYARGL